jgi:hypothetical protein
VRVADLPAMLGGTQQRCCTSPDVRTSRGRWSADADRGDGATSNAGMQAASGMEFYRPTGPPAQLDDLPVRVAVDPQLAGLERPILAEGLVEPSRHLHLPETQPLTVRGRGRDERQEHDPPCLRHATSASDRESPELPFLRATPDARAPPPRSSARLRDGG